VTISAGVSFGHGGSRNDHDAGDFRHRQMGLEREDRERNQTSFHGH
jgi:hypothetical protein